MTLRQSLMLLELEQVIELGGLHEQLLLPMDRQNSVARVQRFAAWLAGEVSWHTAIEEALAAGDLRRAIEIHTEARNAGEAVPSDTRERLEHEWRRRVEVVHKRREHALEELQSIDPATEAAHAAAQECLGMLMIHADLPGGEPELPAYTQLSDLDGYLKELLDREIDAILEMAEMEASQDLEQTLELSRRAWDALLRAVTSPDATTRIRELFLALPRLVLNRRIPELETLGAEATDFATVAIDLPTGAPLARPELVPRLCAARPTQAADSAKLSLRAFSRRVVDTVKGEGPPFEGDEAFHWGKTLQAGGGSSFDSEARVWIRAARASEEGWSERAFGRGLLAFGRHYMEQEALTSAFPLLEDAVELLGTFGGEPRVFNKAVLALLAAKVWPAHRARGAGLRGHSIREWARSSELPLSRDQVASTLLVDEAARIWSDDIRDIEAARRFLETVVAEVGADLSLYQKCIEVLVNPANLHKRPRAVCDRVIWLLQGAGDIGSLIDLLDQLVPELGQLDVGRDAPVARYRVRELVSQIEECLDGLRTDTPAPVVAVQETLPRALLHLVGESGASSHEPKLTLLAVCRTFFPRERAKGLLLPILVRNDPSSARARNVHLGIRADHDQGQPPAITLARNQEPVQDLEPGQEHEVLMYFDTTPDVQERVGSVRFVPEVRIDNVLQRVPSFKIEFRPTPQARSARSPFTPGMPVRDEHFIGRQRELEQLRGWIVGDTRRVPVVVGIRRIGKTSLLHRVLQDPEVRQKFFTDYWTVENRPASDTTVHFLKDLAERIRESIPTSFHKHLEFSRASFEERPHVAFDRFVESVGEANLPKRVLVVIDEFDRLTSLVEDGLERQRVLGRPLAPSECVQPEILGTLRKALMGPLESINIVLAGLPKLIRGTSYENRFFGLMSALQVRPFSEDEAQRILDAGTNVMRFSPAARLELLRVTGMQPYLLQVVCDYLYQHMRDEGRDTVALNDVRDVVEEDVLPNESNLADYISLVGADRELLYGLAKAEAAAPKTRRFVSVHEVARALREHGFDWSDAEIQDGLADLVSEGDDVADRPLVERAKNDRTRFRLVVGLLGDHLRDRGPYQ